MLKSNLQKLEPLIMQVFDIALFLEMFPFLSHISMAPKDAHQPICPPGHYGTATMFFVCFFVSSAHGETFDTITDKGAESSSSSSC